MVYKAGASVSIPVKRVYNALIKISMYILKVY